MWEKALRLLSLHIHLTRGKSCSSSQWYKICDLAEVVQRTLSREKFYKMHVKSHQEEIIDPFGSHLMGLTAIEVDVTELVSSISFLWTIRESTSP